MRTSHSGSGTRAAALGIVLLAGTVAALAQTAAFDFAGHWTGSAQQTGKSPVALAADFTTGTVPKTFTGTLSATSGKLGEVPLQCTVHGRQKRNLTVRILLNKCTDRGTILLRGALDPATPATITGHFARVKHGKVKRGTFTLAKGASPSGAFPDDPERSAP